MPNYVPLRRRENDYLMDRRKQKFENFTGIDGVSEQDAAIQDSQGLIADRTVEHLGPTDLGRDPLPANDSGGGPGRCGGQSSGGGGSGGAVLRPLRRCDRPARRAAAGGDAGTVWP